MIAPILIAAAAIGLWLFFFYRAAKESVALRPFREAGEAFAKLPRRKRENLAEQKARQRLQDMEWRKRAKVHETAGDERKALYWSRRVGRLGDKLPSNMLMSCNLMRTYEAHKNDQDERHESGGLHYSYHVPDNIKAVTSRKQMQRIVENLLTPMVPR